MCLRQKDGISASRDHVIIVGYGLNGRNLARVLSETEVPHIALDLDGDTVRREAAHGLPLYYGDATNPNVLRHVKIDDARVLVIAISDPFMARRTVQVARALNPKIHIVVRTRYLRELEELHQLGADDVVPEEFETSIEIFALVLRTYNMPQDFVMRKAEQVRREGYALLRRSELPELAHHLRGGTLTPRRSGNLSNRGGLTGRGKDDRPTGTTATDRRVYHCLDQKRRDGIQSIGEHHASCR